MTPRPPSLSVGALGAHSGSRLSRAEMAQSMAAQQVGHLALSAVSHADLSEIFAVYGDPGTWLHLPSGRHRTDQRARALIDASMLSARVHGLGQWSVRIGPDGVDGLAAGTFIGTGGAEMTPAGVWNLGYRLSPSSWGRGFASELAAAAVAAVARVSRDIPVTARVLSNNPASARVAARVGLEKVWEGPTTTDAADGVLGEIYADRTFDPAALQWLTAHV